MIQYQKDFLKKYYQEFCQPITSSAFFFEDDISTTQIHLWLTVASFIGLFFILNNKKLKNMQFQLFL